MVDVLNALFDVLLVLFGFGLVILGFIVTAELFRFCYYTLLTTWDCLVQGVRSYWDAP